MARADQLQRQRKIDGYAVAAIAPVIALVPAWLIAVASFWWVFVQFYYVPFALFAIVWFLLGGLLFVRPIQRLALQRLLGARTPTRAERDTLQRSWRECRRWQLLLTTSTATTKRRLLISAVGRALPALEGI